MGQITRSMFDFQHAIDRDPDLAAAYYFRAYFMAAIFPVLYHQGLKPDHSEQIKSDLTRAKELGYVVPRDNTDECRQIIAKFRQQQY